MAAIWFDGFDEIPDSNQAAYLASAGYLFATDVTFNTGRSSGGRCLELLDDAAECHLYIGAQTDMYIGFGFKYQDTLVVDEILNFVHDNGTSLDTYMKLQRNLSNGLQVVDGADTILASTVGSVIMQEVWAYIEIRLQLNGASSALTIRINNQVLLDTLIDTTGWQVDRLTFDKSQNGDHLIDDLYVVNTAGTANVSFLGDVFVENIQLSGSASPIDFIPVGSVTNYSNINETGPADDTKYNVSATVGDRDMFQVADLDVQADEIFAVMVATRHAKIGAGAVTARSILNDGVSDTLGTPFSPDLDFVTQFEIFSTAPDGGIWNITDFNSITVGYEVVS